MSNEHDETVHPETGEPYLEDALVTRLTDWVRTELIWYAGSFTFHLLLLSLLLLMGSFTTQGVVGDAPSIAGIDDADMPDRNDFKESPFDKPYVIQPIQEEPPPTLDVDHTARMPLPDIRPDERHVPVGVVDNEGGGTPDGRKEVSMGGNWPGFSGAGDGPKLAGPGGLGPGRGTGTKLGSGGNGTRWPTRTDRTRALLRTGGSITGELAVTAALRWLAHHQLSDGSWSLQRYTERCNDHSCTGPGIVTADAGGTAMGVLPFLAAGQTHKMNCRYRAAVVGAINWLISHQKPDGDLAFGHPQKMYAHALATIALCEAYGMTSDKKVGTAAQGGVNFILNAQNKTTGGWRYNPGDEGDTSVVGWQIMALKSAQLAGLTVGGSASGGAAFEGGSKWLDSVAVGQNGCNFCYQPGTGPSNTMTAVGLLCRQYLGAKPGNPMMADGLKHLLGNLPDPAMSNVYYWYYATQVVYNMGGYDWDTWNRKLRKILVESQCRDTRQCSFGSWDPVRDQWARSGGRVMMTSLCCLILEIHYRQLPLFNRVAGGAEMRD